MNTPVVQLLESGIMCVEYPMHATIRLQDIESEYQQRTALSRKKHPLLVKLHGMAAFEDKAQMFLGSNEHCAITSAAAILMDPTAGYRDLSIILLDMLQHYTRHGFDIQIFDNEEEALAWLARYL